MAKAELYMWNQDRAVEHLKNRDARCRFCGQSVSYFPLEDMLRHTLNHANGDEGIKAQELIKWVTNRNECLPAAFQTLGDPKMIQYCVERGILVRVGQEK
jgi:hypothetical protein